MTRAWGAAFSDQLYTLVEVPPAQAPWGTSFILHWIFLLDISVWAAALMIWRKERRV